MLNSKISVILRALALLPTKVVVNILRAYRFFLSPLLGSNCRFTPSCSEYAITALNQHGFFCGIWLSFKRVIRCHPYSEGGIDLVPEKDKKACCGKHS